jgi:hypothetical protein
MDLGRVQLFCEVSEIVYYFTCYLPGPLIVHVSSSLHRRIKYTSNSTAARARATHPRTSIGCAIPGMWARGQILVDLLGPGNGFLSFRGAVAQVNHHPLHDLQVHCQYAECIFYVLRARL